MDLRMLHKDVKYIQIGFEINKGYYPMRSLDPKDSTLYTDHDYHLRSHIGPGDRVTFSVNRGTTYYPPRTVTHLPFRKNEYFRRVLTNVINIELEPNENPEGSILRFSKHSEFTKDSILKQLRLITITPEMDFEEVRKEFRTLRMPNRIRDFPPIQDISSNIIESIMKINAEEGTYMSVETELLHLELQYREENNLNK